MPKKTDLIIDEVKKVIKGKDSVIKTTLATILAGGHVLLEDIPGVGKTTLAMAFAKSMSLDYRRMQFTPDVLPSDLVGFNMYDKGTGEFRFIKGAVHTNLLLADEINRTSPKTQSALLEVMEEGKATVEGTTYELPKPFFVIATENPYGSSGTQKLPESQLDRFMVCISIGYPDFANAIEILKGNSSESISTLNMIASLEDIREMQESVKNIHVDESLYEYIVNITEATRNPEYFSLGLSPRGSLALLKLARAFAYLNDRDFLTPEDIHDAFLPVVKHRVNIASRQKASGQDPEELLMNLLKDITVPKIEKASKY